MSDGDGGGGDSGGSADPGSTHQSGDPGSFRSGAACTTCSMCDACSLLRLSGLLLAVAAVRPPAPVVLAGLAFYRRRLTRFTPRCPSEPSCSAYAVDAVREHGARRGLAAAARRVRACAPPSG